MITVVNEKNQADLVIHRGAPSAPSAIRTRGPLLRRHSPGIADWGCMWPDVPSGCTDSGWTWPGAARCLPPLARRLPAISLASLMSGRSNAVSSPARSAACTCGNSYHLSEAIAS